jgi:hypothetical protein
MCLYVYRCTLYICRHVYTYIDVYVCVRLVDKGMLICLHVCPRRARAAARTRPCGCCLFDRRWACVHLSICCVCLYIHVYMYTCTLIFAYTYTRLYSHLHMLLYVCILLPTHADILCVYRQIYALPCVNAYKYGK